MASNQRDNATPMPGWPGNADVAVALTFDVDAESAWLGEAPEYGRRLTTLSWSGFGPRRGLSRILDVLRAAEIRATFYVPGHTADHHPSAISAILEDGHEVAHHGYLHLRTDGLDNDKQRAEIEQGLNALGRRGVRPAGYRSPSWELTPETLSFLSEMGFSYDSSLMGDDRPYWETSHGHRLLELPVHWSLDDWPYFGWTPYQGGLLADPQTVKRIWLEEFAAARSEHRLITYTMHPEVIGRGYCMRMLEHFIATIHEQAKPWFATHGEIAALIRRQSHADSAEGQPISPVSSAKPTITLFVNGTLMRGQSLHGNLSEATYRGDIRTLPRYRLLSIGDKHPVMITAQDGEGAAVAGELYEMSIDQLQHALAGEPAGLGLCIVDLEGGVKSLGICWTAPEPPTHSIDISSYGGWREYCASRHP